MNFDINKLNKYIKVADTDSLIISFEEILKKKYPDLDLSNKDKVLPIVKQIQNELRPILNNYQDKLSSEILNSKNHFFDLKPEFIFESAYISGKRRYAMTVVDREGISVDKITMMGIDIAKSNFPPFFKGFGDELIKKVLYSKSREEIDKFLIDFKNSIYEVDWSKLCKPTGIKKIREYIESDPPVGKIFSLLKKKCPTNTKGAIIFNDLLKSHNLSDKYPEIQIGEKIFLTYLKENPYKIKIIALRNNKEDPEFITELVNEYIDKEKLFETILMKKIQKIFDDLGWGTAVLNPFIAEYFSFSQ